MSEQAKRLEAFLTLTEISASERSFGESLGSSIKKWGKMTDRQWTAFQRMEARYSPEVKAARQKWYDDWDEEKARKLRIAVEYYSYTEYFSRVVSEVLKDLSYIPSEKDYRKIVENKYAQRVIETMATEPLYEVGSLVQVRKTARKRAYSLRDRQALVVINDGPVKSAVKGARTYTILPFGESNTVTIEERFLKKARKVR
jgi:hypothetical protein